MDGAGEPSLSIKFGASCVAKLIIGPLHRLVAILRQFMPDPSDKSIGAYFPTSRDGIKDEIRLILSVSAHFSGCSVANFRIWWIVNRS